jgi:aconitate hydratase
MDKGGRQDPFGAFGTLTTQGGVVWLAKLSALNRRGLKTAVDRLPMTIKILLESLLRSVDGVRVKEEDVWRLAQWDPQNPASAGEIPFLPARVLLQDFTGVPCVVDLAALRMALARAGGDPRKVNPLVPCDLVIDHSVQVDAYGSPDAIRINEEKEFERNGERYQLLRWAARAFSNFRLVPPSTGIVHQVNLEYLARVVMTRCEDGKTVAFPDTLVGTDSHTTMINGLGVLGWGVGGIEAEAAMLGQPIGIPAPFVLGIKLTGQLPEGTTATDLVLTLTQRLRARGVVGQWIEFFGPGLDHLPLADRATLANMCPEYGATAAFFPVDSETLNYLRLTGRPAELLDLVERYTKEQGLFRTEMFPIFSDTLELDLSTIEPSLAGPRRPQDRVALPSAKSEFRTVFGTMLKDGSPKPTESKSTQPTEWPQKAVHVDLPSGRATLRHGSVVIAAITSCTNTSNPSVMIGAGLLAKKAVERGLSVPAYVKTSLAPGSRVVTEYLATAGLTPYLERLGFHTVGYGCTTCIGNSGPLPDPVAEAIRENQLVVVAVLSGNRNFEGRIHPLVRANYLASPMLVVAYAIAGTIEIDLVHEPLGFDRDGRPVYLKEIWPSQKEIAQTIMTSVTPEAFLKKYRSVLEGTQAWRSIPAPEGELYDWDPKSTYIQPPPYLADLPLLPQPMKPIEGARVLVFLADSITTDHISPAGSIPPDSPAGRYLIEQGVDPKDFNSYGARRGNDRVMVRGTFANVRLKNRLVSPVEGGWTLHFPSRQRMTIYDAAIRYREEGVPLLVLAGTEYGSGSSRDWAAKGPALLGVRAVLASSFERIHRSNLVGMGIIPLEFLPGENADRLGLTGEERFDLDGIDDSLKPGQLIEVRASLEQRPPIRFKVKVRVDTPMEMEYLRHGGILPYVFRRFLSD